MDREAAAVALLESFATRTGLVGDAPPARYLWTDAFAVCTFLSLDRRRPNRGFLDRARALIVQVHEVLGRHAAGERRGRPLGGRNEANHADHPTRSGLRIGKPRPERGPGQPCDDRLEWERDGQYFHYLTRWMHALERFAGATGDADPHRWATELCRAGLAFVERDDDGRPQRMVWKRSVDLDRVLVASMGQHDPLDGWTTAAELARSPFASDDERRLLTAVVTTYRALDRRAAWPTADPLGLGGLLNAAARCWFDRRPGDAGAAADVHDLLHASLPGLRAWVAGRAYDAPAGQRLAFRELGLEIGLRAVERIAADPQCRPRVERAAQAVLVSAASLPDLAVFWSDPANRAAPSWTEHSEINAVMLAASLVPEDPSHVSIRT